MDLASEYATVMATNKDETVVASEHAACGPQQLSTSLSRTGTELVQNRRNHRCATHAESESIKRIVLHHLDALRPNVYLPLLFKIANLICILFNLPTQFNGRHGRPSRSSPGAVGTFIAVLSMESRRTRGT